MTSQPTNGAGKPSRTPAAASRNKPGKPQLLTVPAIGVKAPVDAVGMQGDAQAVPESFSRTGWWRDGVIPGRPGNAVITGHTWSRGDGVFDQLSKLRRGDVIRLRTTNGSLLTYRVRSVGMVPLDQFGSVAADIYRPSGPSGLVLMTCGDWDGSDYNATRVVQADLVVS